MIKPLEDNKTEYLNNLGIGEDDSVGVQNESSQYIPLWHADYFKLKQCRLRRLRERVCPSPSLPKRISETEPAPGREMSSQKTLV